MRRVVALVTVVFALAGPAAASANITDPNEVAQVVSGTLNQFWSEQLGAINRTYTGPRALVWGADQRTPCGRAQSGNAAYCGANKTIYIGASLFESLVVRSNADYAAAAVLAHEWAHDIQDELGILRWAVAKRYFKGIELQADCYAGVFTRYADQHALLEAGDLDEAVALMTAVGDRALLSPSTPGAHGTSAQRVAWFERGYNTNSLASCMNVYASLYGKKKA